MSELIYCHECRYWNGNGTDDGECRFAAPRAVTVRSGAIWPVTAASDFCGEGESS